MKFKHTIILYFIISVIDFWVFKDLVQSNDAFPYLFIAEKYALGQYYDGISGYWSPLISWLCVPFVLFFKNPVLIIKLLNKFFGLIALYVFNNIISTFSNVSFYLDKVFTILFILLLTIYSHTETPDYLSANLLLAGIYLVVNTSFNNSKLPWLVGVLMALSYFAKLYNFVFSQVLLLCCLLILLAFKEHKFISVLKFYFKQLLIYLFLCFLWINVLHQKFGKWRYEYSSEFNMAIFGPANCEIEDIEKNMINPMVKKGIIIPLENQIYVGADEARIYNTFERWSMLDKQHFNRTWLIIKKNFKSVYYDFVLRYLLFPLVILLLLNLITHKNKLNFISITFVLASMGYVLGYIIVFYSPRYAYLVHFTTFIAFAASVLSFEDNKSRKFKWIYAGFFVFLFIRNLYILNITDINRLKVHLDFHASVEVLKSKKLKGNVCLVANLSPDNAKALDEEQFGYVFINYYLRNKNCGVLNADSLNNNTINLLADNKINYVFAYDDNSKQKLLDLGFTNFANINNQSLAIYTK